MCRLLSSVLKMVFFLLGVNMFISYKELAKI